MSTTLDEALWTESGFSSRVLRERLDSMLICSFSRMNSSAKRGSRDINIAAAFSIRSSVRA